MKSLLRPLCLLGAGLLLPTSLHTTRAQLVTGYVDEVLYQGNGMISVCFDSANRLWVAEKRGRVLVMEPNPGGPSQYAYDYYEVPTTMTDLPADMSTLTPVQSGVINDFSLTPRLRNDNFAMRFTGKIQIPTAGSYTFYLTSDDDSRLFINNTQVVARTSTGSANGSITLPAGEHDIRVEYLEIAGGQNLTVRYAGPGIPQQDVAQKAYKAPSVFADFSSQVQTQSESGMTGLALDPNFASNRHVYVLFATSGDQRIMRLTSNTDFTAMTPGSELLLLSGLPNTAGNHKAGDMHFHPQDPDSLYVALGDDTNRPQVDSLDQYHGKILKLNKTNGQGLATNPHYDGSLTSVRSRIYSAGYRNPFRFCFDPAATTDAIYVSENGDQTDRLVRIEKGAAGGWGSNSSGFLTDSADGRRKVMQTSSASKTGIVIVRSGPLAVNGQPTLYHARYSTNIMRWTLSGAKLDTLNAVPADSGGEFYKNFNGFNIASMTLGPDGALYYTQSGQGASAGTSQRLGRIRFAGGTPPVANFSHTPATGQSPLAVSFTDSSTAPGSTIASREWTFGDGTTSTAVNPSKTYAQPGVYAVTLKVTNAAGVSHTKEVSITVYHQTTVTLTGQVYDARSLPAGNLTAATELRFYQKDGTTPLAVSGGTGAAGNVRTLTTGGVINLSFTAQITGNGIVISAGDPAGDGVQPARIGISLSTTSAAQSATARFYLSDTMLSGRVLDTKGAVARVDVGLSRASAGNYYAFGGGRDFTGGSGIPASGQAHRVVADPLGYYHMPIRTGGGNATFHLDTSADTLAASHGKVKSSITVNSGAAATRDLVIGLYNGGTGETNLSGIPVTPNVNFSTQIQPIFTQRCVECHYAGGDNYGLNLSPGVAVANLVGVESLQAHGVMLVEAGNADRSYLMEKINAVGGPQVGREMKIGDPMTLPERALIRDWINQLPPPSANSPAVITSSLAQSGTVGTPFTYTIAATGNPTPTQFSAAPLPAGLTFSGATISGTPTQAGTFPVTITASNGVGSPDSETLVLTISPSSGGDTNLAPAGTSSASSSQSGNEFFKGNDNSASTRWAAATGSYPQDWQVDLGASRTLSRVDIAWLNAASRAYRYRIEVSSTGVAGSWTTVIDKTNNSTFGDTSDAFSATARYVKITVTSSTGGFASFYECRVFGY